MEKMGITSGQRNTCLELLQQLAYAINEEKYDELYKEFCACAPPTASIRIGISTGDSGPWA